MGYRRHGPPVPLLFGYDPLRDLPADHLARLIEQVVEETVVPKKRRDGPGQPPYDPRLCVKVLIYSYCTGVRSSRVMERYCKESLPYLFLTRGDAPSYRTLCTARTEQGDFVEDVWEGLFRVADAAGIQRLGRIVVDSTKIRANASPEAVVKQEEYAALRAELERIQAEVARVDAQEAVAESGGRTELGKVVPHDQMRDILRRVRQQRRKAERLKPPDDTPQAGASGGDTGDASPAAGRPATLPLEGLPEPQSAAEPGGDENVKPMTAQMLKRIAAALQAVREAEAEGRKHLCLTDPDARMMHGERQRVTRECHSFEVARDHTLLVAAQSTQENHDNARLTALVDAARRHEPGGIHQIDGDSGYYSGTAVAALLREGIDTCIPDSNTAGDLHRHQPVGTIAAKTRGKVPLEHDVAADVYDCPEGNRLVRTQRRQQDGQFVTVYRAEDPCTECPQRGECLTQPNAKRRTLKVADDEELLEAARKRFDDPAQRERYRHRGEKIETVFGFLRAVLGYVRWQLRGKEKVECEARLFKTAYQFRKLHPTWAG